MPAHAVAVAGAMIRVRVTVTVTVTVTLTLTLTLTLTQAPCLAARVARARRRPTPPPRCAAHCRHLPRAAAAAVHCIHPLCLRSARPLSPRITAAPRPCISPLHVRTATVITSPRLRAPLHRFCTSAPLHLCACAPLQGYPSAIAVPGALAGAATATAAPMVTVQGRQVGAPSVGAPSVTVAGQPAQVATATAVPPTYSQ